jgi:hypothetical protein
MLELPTLLDLTNVYIESEKAGLTEAHEHPTYDFYCSQLVQEFEAPSKLNVLHDYRQQGFFKGSAQTLLSPHPLHGRNQIV